MTSAPEKASSIALSAACPILRESATFATSATPMVSNSCSSELTRPLAVVAFVGPARKRGLGGVKSLEWG